MAYCQSLVKLEKGFPPGVRILEDSTYVLVFSCFRSCSISPHLLRIIALGGTVCWPGCVSKRDNASRRGFADESQAVFPGKSCEQGDFRDGTAGFWVLGVGLPLVLFSHPRGDRCCWYHIHFSLGWMQTVTGGGFYSLDVNAFTSKALSATVSSRSSSKCLHGIKSQD